MIRYYNGRHYNAIREQSTIVFEEEASGIYNVSKDRTGVYDEYVIANDVTKELTTGRKIAVVRRDESIFTNFDVVNN
jgi:hypothetical protein